MDEIHPLFAPQALSDEALDRIHDLRLAFSNLLRFIEASGIPECRELSLARTKLQEAALFAVRAAATERQPT